MGFFVCLCKDWEDGMEQIDAAQSLSRLHGIEYTGKAFKFCPWCGQTLMQPGSIKYIFANLGKSIWEFRAAFLATRQAIKKMGGVDGNTKENGDT